MRILSFIFSIFIIASVLSACKGGSEENMVTDYKNPVVLEDEWEDYGLGDPYVFKYNGIYYLYVSTRDTDTGIKIWSSKNLVDWKYEGLTADEKTTKAAYAPEVIYWNGFFYMYTSPGGNGHYILQSESPTGPFEVVTENLGRTIDGNVFIDDDGSKYFSYAGDSGIDVAPMSDPVTIGEGKTTDAYMDGWTEGSTIFKRNGKYYMTYTGNHVFSDAYRIDYAISEEPMGEYVPSEQNPALISTEGPTVGLGHNSIVKGPDLDTDYMFYHNLEGPGVVGPLRHMNMDRIAWNGDHMEVLGPTVTEQPAPRLPQFSDHFNRKKIGSDWENINGGKWDIHEETYLRQQSIDSEQSFMQVTKEVSDDNYTAEFHGKMVESGTSSNPQYGSVFSYQDDQNYGVALLNPNENKLLTRFTVDGEQSEWEASDLPSGFDHSKLHQIRVEKDLGTFHIYVDGMLKQTINADLDGGKVGYLTEDVHAEFGYTAFNNEVNGSNVWDLHKPLPGTIQAVHYSNGADGGYQSNESENNDVYRNDPIKIEETQNGDYSVQLNKGEWLNYKVNVAETDNYYADLRIIPNEDDVRLRLSQDDTDISGEIVIPSSDGSDDWGTITLKDLELEKGKQDIKVEVLEGEIELSSLTFFEGQELSEQTDNFADQGNVQWDMYEGYWSKNDGIFSPAEGPFSKVLMGETGWTDYSVQSDIKVKKDQGDAGIIVRALYPANGAERQQNNPNFNQGYYAYIQADGVYLAKQNFDRDILEHVSTDISLDSWHQLKVDVSGTNIQVYLDDMDSPVIEYEDRSIQPFTHGQIGLLSVDIQAEFKKFKVTEIDN